jgi:hypothetical protein
MCGDPLLRGLPKRHDPRSDELPRYMLRLLGEVYDGSVQSLCSFDLHIDFNFFNNNCIESWDQLDLAPHTTAVSKPSTGD